MIILDGKKVSEKILESVKQNVSKLNKKPHLVVLLVGEDPASRIYVRNKQKAAEKVGINSTVLELPSTTTEEELLTYIQEYNTDEKITGILVQLPLPRHIDKNKVVTTISPKKDVDGFTLYNIGLMQLGEPCYLPATPFGILELLKRSNVEISGKHVVVLGRSNIVGTPVSVMLSRRGIDATVTICHTKTQNIQEITRQADILIAAVGQPHFVKADMVKEGAVVVDVGIHRIKDNSEKGYHIIGDVDFDEVYKKASKITPVPGGVGPMTIVSLLHNTLLAAKKNRK
jgi:methylenetetrahydrofolate dehydrogenase (NADP+)/methenyltetrahydrofolate cyclohydrolase